MTGPVALREARDGDAGAMAAVLVAAWQAGYRGVLDDAVIDGTSVEQWRVMLERPIAPGSRTVLATDDPSDRVLGFVRFGPAPEPPHEGLIASVYVHPEAAGHGLGRRLVQHATEGLHADGHRTVTLWVFRDNARARALYERCGFVADGAEQTDPRWGAPQVRYRLSSASDDSAGGSLPSPLGGLIRVSSPTEERNPRTADIDRLPVLELLQRLNDEDARVPDAVAAVLPALAELVDIAVDRLAAGGQVHYFGAGSSGRLGLLDAAELPPTFGVGPDMFVAHLAGGDAAIRRAQEGAEDDAEQGAREAALVSRADVVVGLASSGYTPYVGGALGQANAVGAHTALITSNPDAPLARLASTLLYVDTGPEAITGSTRLKSATAQKLVLNAFSTAVMVRSGRTWSNLMVDLMPTNAKLRGRLSTLLSQATGATETACETALLDADHEPKTALVMLLAETDPDRARAALAAAGGRVAAALDTINEG